MITPAFKTLKVIISFNFPAFLFLFILFQISTSHCCLLVLGSSELPIDDGAVLNFLTLDNSAEGEETTSARHPRQLQLDLLTGVRDSV